MTLTRQDASSKDLQLHARAFEVNRLDDTCLAVRPDIEPFRKVKQVAGDCTTV